MYDILAQSPFQCHNGSNVTQLQYHKNMYGYNWYITLCVDLLNNTRNDF